MPSYPPAVLTIAGLDPSGRAGVVADIRAILAMGAQPRAVVAVQTVQGIGRPLRSTPVDAQLVGEQVRAALADGGVAAVKIGALGTAEVVTAVAAALRSAREAEKSSRPTLKIVIDPIFRASSGLCLLDDDGVQAWRKVLWPLADVITPNLEEAALLLGLDDGVGDGIKDEGAMVQAACALVDVGDCSVLLTGGHLPGDQVVDVLAGGGVTRSWSGPKLNVEKLALRGTGCRLSSALAASLAMGLQLDASCMNARAWLGAELKSVLCAPDGCSTADV